MGKNYLRDWSGLGCLRVVCDPDPDRLQFVQSQYSNLETCSDINPDGIEVVINERTRAIIPIHLYGQMADIIKDFGEIQVYTRY